MGACEGTGHRIARRVHEFQAIAGTNDDVPTGLQLGCVHFVHAQRGGQFQRTLVRQQIALEHHHGIGAQSAQSDRARARGLHRSALLQGQTTGLGQAACAHHNVATAGALQAVQSGCQRRQGIEHGSSTRHGDREAGVQGHIVDFAHTQVKAAACGQRARRHFQRIGNPQRLAASGTAAADVFGRLQQDLCSSNVGRGRFGHIAIDDGAATGHQSHFGRRCIHLGHGHGFARAHADLTPTGDGDACVLTHVHGTGTRDQLNAARLHVQVGRIQGHTTEVQPAVLLREHFNPLPRHQAHSALAAGHRGDLSAVALSCQITV